jgi:hypothetical protein
MALLDIVKDAAVLVGLSQPSAVASSTDRSALEFLTLANMCGRELMKWHDWSALSVAGSFVGDGTTTTFVLPADFDRFAQGQDMILDGGVGTIAHGPLDPTAITVLRARSPISVSYLWYRRGTQVIMSPALGAGRSAIYEYQSRNWAASSAGTPKAKFEVDTDVSRIDEDLMTLCLIWMWKRQKGLDYSQEYENCRTRFNLLAGEDRPLRPVASSPPIFDLPQPITPDTIVVA